MRLRLRREQPGGAPARPGRAAAGAAAYRRAAVAGARVAAAAPASRSIATAAVSPARAERSTWWARSSARRAARRRAPARCARGRAAASRRARPRRPRARTSGWRKRKRRGTSVGAHEVAAQEVVERVQRRLLAHAGGRRGQLGLERVARDGRAREHLAGAVGELRELAGQRGGDRARHLDARQRDRRARPRALRRARELLQVERVAAAVGVDVVGGRRRPARAPRLALRCAELDPGQRSRARQRRREPLRHLARADREREQHRRGRRAPQQRAEQLERAGVGPVQVVEDRAPAASGRASSSSSARTARCRR